MSPILSLILPVGMYFEDQIPDIRKALENSDFAFDEETIRCILFSQNCYIKYHGTILELITNESLKNLDLKVDKFGFAYDGCDMYCYGNAAISFILGLCRQNETVRPYDEISVPLDVFEECTPEQWVDISSLFADIMRRVSDYYTFHDQGVDFTVHSSFDRYLWLAVNQLEVNKPYLSTGYAIRPNGIQRQSLYDIGYSLRTGWSDRMKRVLRDRLKPYQSSLDIAFSENDKLK